MALEEKKVIGRVTLHENDMVEIREDYIILKDGVEIARTYHRKVIDPDHDTTLLPARVRRITDACWTPDVIQKFRDRPSDTTETPTRGA